MDGERDQVAGGDQADGVDQAGPGMQGRLAGGEGSRVHASGYAVADEQDGEHGQFGKDEKPHGDVAGQVPPAGGLNISHYSLR